MKRRTLILRLWRDATGALTVQLNDPLGEMHARFVAAEELWAALEQWSKASALVLPQNESFSKELKMCDPHTHAE